MPRNSDDSRFRFFHDFAYDLLAGIATNGEPVLPHHLCEGAATDRQRMDFSRNVQNSYTLRSVEGQYVLLHERKPGHHDGVTGERNSAFGTRIIPRKGEIDDLVAMVR